ncbi:uncharacterized protein MONOS_16480c2 [Monocercomonoides exilis]|uniref:uncharacterized protein n=1 Tax=Monocercomonoides exilis TaxID=2049356 RepID=UPI00355A27EC|nr:hypothetical protein MONOS_16480c1 [Monocercomonoides exilis]KAH7824333.1 hypothetical protein MONOS_16480c2 [Monocercomonoides exilis]|eukprot:MONOS_16480.1-p1 / transcript=MONOS_16480.1 / gene=MONOS_16480 / organism=Monocercomonoides_exilis_PA203 / gene_product=unspecified product / transcript_product=unspecified product / location=Mono_scaffold01781:1318-2109(+) / protein_length=263 / sequence_SO=supercontig / SO=protein_coding / is_pseudo=false
MFLAFVPVFFTTLFVLSNQIIPTKVYTYTNVEMQPSMEHLLQKTAKELSPIPVIMFNKQSLPFYAGQPELPRDFDSLNFTMQSMVLQPLILEKYGGVWIDQNVFVRNKKLVQSLVDEANKEGADCLWTSRITEQGNYPFNGVVVARAHSALMKSIAAEQRNEPFQMTQNKMLQFTSQNDKKEKIIVKPIANRFTHLKIDCTNRENAFSDLEKLRNNGAYDLVQVDCKLKMFSFPIIFIVVLLLAFFFKFYSLIPTARHKKSLY